MMLECVNAVQVKGAYPANFAMPPFGGHPGQTSFPQAGAVDKVFHAFCVHRLAGDC